MIAIADRLHDHGIGQQQLSRRMQIAVQDEQPSPAELQASREYRRRFDGCRVLSPLRDKHNAVGKPDGRDAVFNSEQSAPQRQHHRHESAVQ